MKKTNKENLFINGDPENTRTYFINDSDIEKLQNKEDIEIRDEMGFNVKLIYEE